MKLPISSAFALVLLSACTSNQSVTPATPATPATSAVSASSSVINYISIPKPSDMKAEVTTNGRVSTIIDVDVASVGQHIPFTYSAGKVANTPGFSWYVSKHFALKTDFEPERAAFFLRLLELSYPYYVEFFGMEPPNIDNQRIASTYATSNDKLRLAMFDDGFNRGIHDYAGGEAMYYNYVGYSFPTERPQHQRYIAIHETMHSYQMALGNYPWTPSWHGEGLGDSTANHIFDSQRQQLTVFGHDVPIFDMMSWALDSYKKESPSIVDIHNRKRFDRGLNVLFVQFMYNHPEYAQYIKIYNQEITRLKTASKETSLAVLQDVVPDWQALEAAFKIWVGKIEQTHEVASRGQWEIDGNRFYKRASNYKYGPQRVDFNFTPAGTPKYDPYRLDFPLPDDSHLVLKAQRGVDEPTIGFEIQFNPKQMSEGKIGFAMAVKSSDENNAAKAADYRGWKEANTDNDQQLRIELIAGKTLAIDGKSLGVDSQNHELPAAMIESLIRQSSPKLGVSAQIKQSHLWVVVKVADSDDFVVNLAIDNALRSKLMTRKFGLLSENNQHSITPYIDDGRDLNPHLPDYSRQTAANAWGFSGDGLALRFARAIWQSNGNAPLAWQNAFADLNTAALDKDNGKQQLQGVIQRLPELARIAANNKALAELSGVQLQLDWLGGSLEGLTLNGIVTNQGVTPISGEILFSVAGERSKSASVSLNAGQKQAIAVPKELLGLGAEVTADFRYSWHDVNISQTKSQQTKQYRGYELGGLEYQFGEDTMTLSADVFGPFAGETKGTVTFDLHYGDKRDDVDMAFSIDPYQQKTFSHSFNVEQKALKDAWFEVTVVAEVDGEPVTLRKRMPVRVKKK